MKRIILLFILILCTSSLFSQAPTQFQLYQNTPDPFDTSGTNISFDLPIAASVSLWVVDSMGNTVANLLAKVSVTEGTQSFRWNARRQDGSFISPGYYVCKMRAQSEDTTFSASILMRFDSVPITPVIPTQFKLYQNIPEPSDEFGTYIGYDLPWSVTNVKFTIVDSTSGEDVAIWDSAETFGKTYWRSFKPSKYGTYFCKMEVDSLETTIFSDSIWMHFIAGVSRETTIIPTQFALHLNIPDPFCNTSGTVIQYDLPKPAIIHLWIEDSLQQLVDTIISGLRNAGICGRWWNARKQDGSMVSPGPYICRMRADTLGITIFSDSILMHVESCTSVGDEDGNIIPLSFTLHQNYPNPFNPLTTIEYQVSTRSHVSLRVFDVLGREIATLVDVVQDPGYKSVNFNANGLVSGVYFYRLQAGSYVETKKLVLLR